MGCGSSSHAIQTECEDSGPHSVAQSEADLLPPPPPADYNLPAPDKELEGNADAMNIQFGEEEEEEEEEEEQEEMNFNRPPDVTNRHVSVNTGW